jgi:hypothetical protein|uniref:Uncharacterized protein n=1 Tax=Siphoviridae sp. ctJ7x27 TaxID=2827835 RepID=A0A8S5S4T3_9CAUD|nr:MAG TPA: hypothetical protein [Siphoviridae sp. ctJ7x27]
MATKTLKDVKVEFESTELGILIRGRVNAVLRGDTKHPSPDGYVDLELDKDSFSTNIEECYADWNDDKEDYESELSALEIPTEYAVAFAEHCESILPELSDDYEWDGNDD